MSNLSIIEEYPKLTFSELKELSINDVSICVSQSEAICICKLSLQSREVDYSDIQKLWLNKLLKAYKVEELSESNWIEILSFLDETFKQLVCIVLPIYIMELKRNDLYRLIAKLWRRKL